MRERKGIRLLNAASFLRRGAIWPVICPTRRNATLWLAVFLISTSLLPGWLACAKLPGRQQKINIFLSPVPPAAVPETIPVVPGRNATAAGDDTASSPDFMHYEPYNIYPRELDLSELEARHFVRGPAVISPNKSTFVYTEAIFDASNRQTFSRLYRVVVTALPGMGRSMPDENEVSGDPNPTPISLQDYTDRYEPDKNLQNRESLLAVGYDKIRRFDFRTLTIVDWSASGRRLLIKEKSGVLHMGLRTSDIIVFDEKMGTVTIYPEIRRIIEYYWRTKGNLPNLNRLTWDLYPLGWEPSSDSAILLKGWAMDSKEKKFLGVWRYDLDTERAELTSPDDQPVPTAANGYIGTPSPLPPPKPDRRHGL